MNLTYVLGNGMDLQLGLPTRFSDFYEWAQKNGKENMFLPHTYNEKCIEDWADYESILIDIFNDYLLVFSNRSDEIKINKYKKFYFEQLKNNQEPLKKGKEEFFNFLIDEVDNVSNMLQEYLQLIDSRIKNIKDVEVIFYKLKEQFLYIDRLFQNDTNSREKINNYVGKVGASNRHINIITLNYTCTSELLYNTFKNQENVKINRKNNIFNNGNSLIYLHGRLPSLQWNEGITIGIHSIKEIDENFRDLEDAKYLVKSEKMAEIIGSRVYSNAKRILSNNANIIICYGISFGNSDRSLLAAVINKARKNGAIIIFYEYINSDKSLARTRMHLKSKIVKRITSSFSDLTQEDMQNIKNNLIAVPINDNINLIPKELRLFDYAPENIQNKEPII